MLVVDVLALALYIVVSLPALTGVGPHEWLGSAWGSSCSFTASSISDFVTAFCPPPLPAGTGAFCWMWPS